MRFLDIQATYGKSILLGINILVCLILLFPYSCKQDDVRVFTIGDSTMSHYDVDAMDVRYGGEDFPRRGWAMALSAYLNDKVEVKNHAVSGRSSKNFITQGYWDKVKNEIKKGDFLIIQFGHNDEKKDDPKRFTEPYGEFKDNLLRYVKESQALGARPILATPIARRRFNSEGQLVDTHGDYVIATREAAKESGVPLVDLNKMTMDYLSKLGPDESKKLFLHIEPGVFKNLPDGMTDDTHLSKHGACVVAGMLMEGLEKTKYALKKYGMTKENECFTKIK